MAKEIEQTIIYDKCPQCGGVWLDKGELEALAAMASAQGQASGQACGVMLGMAMAPHHAS
jgi:Zn-finger nucleic acid-binding protein